MRVDDVVVDPEDCDDAIIDDASWEVIPPLLDAAIIIGLTTGLDDGAEEDEDEDDEEGGPSFSEEGGGGLHPV